MRQDEVTITMSVAAYVELQEEIKTLKNEVKEKTIIKYVVHPIYGQLFAAGVVIWFLFSLFT